MYRASLHDLGKAFPLRLIEIAVDLDSTVDAVNEALGRLVAFLAVLGVNPAEVVGGRYGVQDDVLMPTIERQGDAGAGC